MLEIKDIKIPKDSIGENIETAEDKLEKAIRKKNRPYKREKINKNNFLDYMEDEDY